MITVLFRWDIKPQCEQAFKEGWSEIIHCNIEKYGALGARLHKTDDNQWISYSQWLSEEHYNNAQNCQDKHQSAHIKMTQAIQHTYKPIIMVPVLDHLLSSEISLPSLLS
ncbi:MAG: antibiotic biosynthesis monooxygenase [Psychromonas sp.]